MQMQWRVRNDLDPAIVASFTDKLNSSPILARVLLNRGVMDIEAARSFFKPQLSHMHDPLLMAGMQAAVETVEKAITQGKKILIYGDYDVDGTTATAMLLRFFRSADVEAGFYIPDRLLEGYGVSEKGIHYARENNFGLIICVDCGITAFSATELARTFGIDVVICDHHQPAAQMPHAAAILNPKRPDCEYPFKELAGVGVAFKLAQALQRHLGLAETVLHSLLPLAALGSAADVVPLIDENRILVKFGLQNIKETTNLGIRALLETCGLGGRDVGTGQVVFMLAPRINAVGRLGDAGRAVRLLTTEDEKEARDIATVLEAENLARRGIDEQTFKDAIEVVEKSVDVEKDRVFVLAKESWHPGVIGIVASRIVEKYYRPTVMIATEKGEGKGSARSIPGFNIFEALEQCSDLMSAFGGHKYAAGLSIKADKIPELRERLNERAAKTLTDEMLTQKLTIDAEIDLNEIKPDLLKLLQRMAPFGPQNMRPVFMSTDLQVVGTPAVVGKNHLKFKVRQNGQVMDAIGYNLGHLQYRISPGEKGVQMAYVIDENEWQGRKTLQLRVKDLR